MELELLYGHWIIFGIALILLEIFLASFTIFWFGCGAVIVGICYLLFPSIPLWGQVFVWSVSSLLLAVLWFKYIKPRRQKITSDTMKEIQGEVGLVIRVNDEHNGRLRFPAPVMGDDEWDFICEETISIGDRICVIGTEKNKLMVKKT